MLATDTYMSINKLKYEPEVVFVELAAIDYDEAALYQWYRKEFTEPELRASGSKASGNVL